ncbi:hypothetical protein B0H13DRAFT_2561832 [Mycena leptocephala]|nr:hypothetical protein B0H13DRAFT_2561832 [Mycena leptocephala]
MPIIFDRSLLMTIATPFDWGLAGSIVAKTWRCFPNSRWTSSTSFGDSHLSAPLWNRPLIFREAIEMYAFLFATSVVGCKVVPGLDSAGQGRILNGWGGLFDVASTVRTVEYLWDLIKGPCLLLAIAFWPKAFIGGNRSDEPITPSGLGGVASAIALRNEKGGGVKKCGLCSPPYNFSFSAGHFQHEQLPFDYCLLRSEPFLSPAEARGHKVINGAACGPTLVARAISLWLTNPGLLSAYAEELIAPSAGHGVPEALVSGGRGNNNGGGIHQALYDETEFQDRVPRVLRILGPVARLRGGVLPGAIHALWHREAIRQQRSVLLAVRHLNHSSGSFNWVIISGAVNLGKG